MRSRGNRLLGFGNIAPSPATVAFVLAAFRLDPERWRCLGVEWAPGKPIRAIAHAFERVGFLVADDGEGHSGADCKRVGATLPSPDPCLTALLSGAWLSATFTGCMLPGLVMPHPAIVWQMLQSRRVFCSYHQPYIPAAAEYPHQQASKGASKKDDC